MCGSLFPDKKISWYNFPLCLLKLAWWRRCKLNLRSSTVNCYLCFCLTAFPWQICLSESLHVCQNNHSVCAPTWKCVCCQHWTSVSYNDTCTQTHKHRNAHEHTGRRTQLQTQMHTHTNENIWMNIYVYTHTHTHTYEQTHAYIHQSCLAPCWFCSWGWCVWEW